MEWVFNKMSEAKKKKKKKNLKLLSELSTYLELSDQHVKYLADPG